RFFVLGDLRYWMTRLFKLDDPIIQMSVEIINVLSSGHIDDPKHIGTSKIIEGASTVVGHCPPQPLFSEAA
ncbi:hypothetical protein E8E15_000169, partial [Penicillium rubens]